LDLQCDLNNHTFENLHTFSLIAQRLVGHRALLTLCSHLPHLAQLFIRNTKCDDTELTLAHNKLTHCKIENCGITTVDSVIAPRLRYWSLRSNKLTQFNIHTLGLQPCNIDLRNNDISLVYTED